MSEELKKYFIVASLIYRDILFLNHVQIKNNKSILYWDNIPRTSQCAFNGNQEELKQFLDDLIS